MSSLNQKTKQNNKLKYSLTRMSSQENESNSNLVQSRLTVGDHFGKVTRGVNPRNKKNDGDEVDDDDDDDDDDEDADDDDDDDEEEINVKDSDDDQRDNDEEVECALYKILKSKCKHKGKLVKQDFMTILAASTRENQTLTGKDLKANKSLWKLKNIISKLILTAMKINDLSPFLKMVNIHLDNISEYIEISAEVISQIAKILKIECKISNLEYSELADYFHKRFADFRNRQNYVAK